MILSYGLFLIVMIASAVWTLNRQAEENRREKWEHVTETVKNGDEFVTRETTLFNITAGSWYAEINSQA